MGERILDGWKYCTVVQGLKEQRVLKQLHACPAATPSSFEASGEPVGK